ncbi:hypothetical protein CHS0354_006545 [Potamilus streckersoni]|uniref:Receptor ligand binding region domain-containing protein n=1 Tax=Potamilus streckersoni TaxID=2493646 RepID=A0AAE0WC50_9BIVA|nr:hypothetical protein CHS0354_006545 [Potamilus streckersoni]
MYFTIVGTCASELKTPIVTLLINYIFIGMSGVRRVILSLMKLLEWNRVGIVYDNDTYGIGASESLKKLAEQNGICVPVFCSIAVDTAEAIDTSAINSILDDIALKTSSPVGGIIFFTGAANTAKSFLLAAERFQEGPTFIFSDGIMADEGVFQYGGSVLKKSKGSFAVVSPKAVVTEFQTYWKKLFKNVTLLLEESHSNPWLLDVFQLVNRCKPYSTSPCPNMSEDGVKKAFPSQPLYVQYSIH